MWVDLRVDINLNQIKLSFCLLLFTITTIENILVHNFHTLIPTTLFEEMYNMRDQ